MKKIIFIMTLLSVNVISFAQNGKALQSRHMVIDLFYVKMNRFVDSLFAATTRLNKCASGVSFVQFTINNRGELRNIKTNEGTPGYLDTLLVDELHKNNFNFKQAGLVNKTAILPVIYSFDLVVRRIQLNQDRSKHFLSNCLIPYRIKVVMFIV